MHVVQRGNNRGDCFRSEVDYLVYLTHLRELSAKHACAVHAYCLMTNHVHLLLTPSDARGCTYLMRDLGQRYVQYFNRRHGRTGTLWEGRFRSCLTQSAAYVLACYRYIELNPVRAGMVAGPAEYPWSSFLGNIGRRSDALIEPHVEYIALAAEPEARRRAYADMLATPLLPALVERIRNATQGGYPLGSESFLADIARKLGCKTEPGRPGPRRSGSDPEFRL